mgnify:CR=1 FL=1
MAYEDILRKVIDVFALIADNDDVITVDSELIEDLGVSSMDVLMMICNLEEEFKVKVPEKMIRCMATIGDVVDIMASLIQSK